MFCIGQIVCLCFLYQLLCLYYSLMYFIMICEGLQIFWCSTCKKFGNHCSTSTDVDPRRVCVSPLYKLLYKASKCVNTSYVKLIPLLSVSRLNKLTCWDLCWSVTPASWWWEPLKDVDVVVNVSLSTKKWHRSIPAWYREDIRLHVTHAWQGQTHRFKNNL